MVWCEVNVRVLGNWLELESVNGGRFEINQLLFADDTEVPKQSPGSAALGRMALRRRIRVILPCSV